jgi:hypothetical protein
MKKHDEPSTMTPFNAEPSPKAHVRYLGFEAVEGGRRLKFSVKPVGHESMEIISDISDSVFIGVSQISIQDAAPMVYEKLVELLAAENTLDPQKLCLTDADIAQYITRHLSPQKRAHSSSDGRRRSYLAA